MDTPFELRVEPQVTRLGSVAEAKAFVRDYVRLSRAEPLGGYGKRYGADLDLEGIAEELRRLRGEGLPDDASSSRFLLDAVAELVREGTMRPGPLNLQEPIRGSGFSVTLAGEAWLAADSEGFLTQHPS